MPRRAKMLNLVNRKPRKLASVLVPLLTSFILLASSSVMAKEPTRVLLNKDSLEESAVQHYQTADLIQINDVRQVSLPIISRAIQSAKLFSRMSGFITAQYVEIGDKVNKNDVLAVIDDPEVKAQEQKILANIASEQAEKELNQLNLTRVEQLANSKLVSDAERDLLRIMLRQSNAKIDALKSELAQNLQRQSFLSIRAPFSGYIVEKNIELGDLVNADNPQTDTYLYRIANTQKLKIIAYVPQSEIKFLTVGDNINATFTGYDGLIINTQITRMAKAVEESTGTMLIEAEFDNTSLNLPSGLRGIMSFDTAQQSNAQVYWQAPISALTYHQGNTAIVGIKDGNKRFYKINIISQSTKNVVFTSKLEQIEKVILNPNALLFNS